MPGIKIAAASTFTRPNDITAYASGDLVANSTTAGSVTTRSFALGTAPGSKGRIHRCRVYKSGTSVANAAFRLHLYDGSAALTYTNGDNGAYAASGVAQYLGYLDVTAMTAHSDGAAGVGSGVGNFIAFKLPATISTVYGALEARGAYTPTANETFTCVIEAELE